MKTLLSLAIVVLTAPMTLRAADIATLVAQLKSGDSDARRAAAKELAGMGEEAKAATPALVAALKSDKDLFVRRFAAQALGSVGADPKVAVPALQAVLKDEPKELQEAAVGALAKMGATGVPALVQVLKGRDAMQRKPKPATKGGPPPADATAFLRAKAAVALGGLGADAKAAVPALVEALRDAAVRVEAATALGDIGPSAKDAIKPLQDAISGKANNRDRAFRTAVSEALKKIQAKE